MATEPVFESLKLSKNGGKIETSVKAECKTDIPTDGIDKVIGVFAVANLTDKETSEGVIKCGGKIVYQVFCQAETGELKKYESSCEYAGTINDDRIKEDTSSSLEVKVLKAEADANGTKLAFSAILSISGELFRADEIAVLKGGEDLIVKEKETSVIKGYGIKTGTYSVEEEFDLPYAIKEVLAHKAEPRITTVQCGVGCIIADGEIVLSALLLQNTENSDIIRENKIIPFRMELDCDEAMPAMGCTAFVFPKSFKTDISVDEEAGKSTVSAVVNLQFESEAFVSEEITVAEDVFSLKDDLAISREEFTYNIPEASIGCNAEINERVSIKDLPADARITAVGGETVEITSVKSTDLGLKIEGVIKADLYYKDGEGKNSAIAVETPFETDAACVLKEDCDIKLKSITGNVIIKQISSEEAELSADLLLTVYSYGANGFKYIKEVSVTGEKKTEDSAISVYIPREGEELWSLAKRLNATPESIMSANKDLQFPLTGKERIAVYRQK